MRLVRHLADQRVHFSDLKQMDRSPAHYLHHVLHPKSATRAMLVGAYTDALVFGGKDRFAVFEGDRRGTKAWESFCALNRGRTLLTTPESEDAMPVAAAILAHPEAMRWLRDGEYQRVVQWDMHGLPFAAGVGGQRGGFDCLGETHLADLKVCFTSEPETLQRHAQRMYYHAQLACYRAGCAAIGRPVRDVVLICAEAAPPHPITCLRLSEATLEAGEKLVSLWSERLRACESADEWPGYVQDTIDWELEADTAGLVFGDEDAA